ncbi:flagellin [Methanocalculus taiwanensis]|uniref:Flagellin n=1 Tax=Methanocalculus taiwanensis TaxID=106207 RepID=A0ABD4TJB8_9EURY|nr:flagellin [Methanocalculus taiwanensis]
MKKQNENGFTGLEAAIVLIAFVVVAAVFSYVMLGAGFFTSQKAQEVVHTGMGQAASSIEVHGIVYGYGNGTGDNQAGIDTVTATIALTSGMQAMNISAMQVTYTDPTNREFLTYTSGNAAGGGWNISKFFNNITADTVLEPNEKFTLTFMPTTAPGNNTRFTLALQPEQGALTTIVRSTPAAIYPVNALV